eukprot:Amastigsp_a678881_21.p4 type:complete len:147 gc:universal Amastigsp_a678881_21:1400-960(-)
MLSGSRSSRTATSGSRPSASRTRTSPCSSRSRSSPRRRTTSRALRPRSHGSPVQARAISPSPSPSALRPRPSCTLRSPTGFSRTATFRCGSTNGAQSSAGSFRTRPRSSARASSSGRRATLPTPPSTRRLKRCSKFSTSTAASTRN